MAIDLPPPLPPALTIPGAIVEASQTQGAYIRRVGDFALQLSGIHYLAKAELDQIFSQAKTPSEAIILMNTWTHRRGHLLVQYIYTRPVNGVIHVRAIQKTLGEISGDDLIRAYFKDLKGEQTPKRADFVLKRSQASLQSERAGVDYSVSYREQAGNSDVIDMQLSGVADEQHSPWSGAAQLGNEGSRFAGRYFASATLRRDFSTGTQLSAVYQTAIPDWGETELSEDLNAIEIKANQVTPWGVYALDIQQTEYERRLQTADVPAISCPLALPLVECLLPSAANPADGSAFSADINQVTLRGQQILSADVDRRVSITQELQWVDSNLEMQNGARLQDETYLTLQLGSSYERAQLIDDKTLQWTLGLELKGGLSGDSGTLGNDRTTDGLSNGKRTAQFLMLKPSVGLAYEFAPNYQLAASFISQFANEQLPQQQQWTLGGVNTLRAYLPGVLIGDTGAHLSASLVRSSQFNNATLDISLFAEVGTARYENASGRNGSGVSIGSFSSLADAGLSATLKVWERLAVSAVVARSLADSNIDSTQVEQAEVDFFVVVRAIF